MIGGPQQRFVTRFVRILCAGIAVGLVAGWGMPVQAGLDKGQWSEDTRHLSAAPHRLPGSPEAQAAADYISARLTAAGVDTVQALTFETWQPVAKRVELVLGDSTIPLAPLRPNATVLPTTPPSGLQGPLIYAGRGELADYGTVDPSGHIVLLDYDSFDNWRYAFALGAKAVIFIGDDGSPTRQAPRHVNVPVNFVRLYVDRDALPVDPAELNGTTGTVFSQMQWQPATDQVIWARIRGQDAEMSEPVVLSASFDTFGHVLNRSPGARRAANVALLLNMADYFAKHPPARDVAFLFPGSRAYHHQGAREFYDSFTLPQSDLEDLLAMRTEEREDLRAVQALLNERGLHLHRDGVDERMLYRLLANEAQFLHDDFSRQLHLLRMEHDVLAGLPPVVQARVDLLAEQTVMLDEVRRAIHEDRLPELVDDIQAMADGNVETLPFSSPVWPDDLQERSAAARDRFLPLLEAVQSNTEELLSARLAELDAEEIYWDHVRALRAPLRDETSDDPRTSVGEIKLHVHLDFGDGSARWGVVTGDSSWRLRSNSPHSGGDRPGNYTRFFSQLWEMSLQDPRIQQFVRRTTQDPQYGVTFSGGPYTSCGMIAGLYGTYNINLMTHNDARVRDGHPYDTLEQLEAETLFAQGQEALWLLERVLNNSDLRVGRPIANSAGSKYPEWRNRRSWGDFAAMRVAGGLAESRPAENALLAYWSTTIPRVPTHWDALTDLTELSDYMPFALTRVNRWGRYALRGHPTRLDGGNRLALLGMLFDDWGNVSAINDQTSPLPDRFRATLRITLFPAHGVFFQALSGNRAFSANLSVLKGSTNFGFQRDRVLWGISDDIIFTYLAERELRGGYKLFQFMGPVVMAPEGEDPVVSRGLDPTALIGPVRMSDFTPRNLWDLNESRLASLRGRGVSRADLERMHNRALALREQADNADSLAETEALRMASSAVSHRLYAPLRTALDDLVVAIVILLALSLPFAFAMERLLIGATGVYGRIVGFCSIFGITFILLYFLHPGFEISTAPMIIFLAFAIIGLASIVIQMLLRRFRQELQLMQGQGQSAHQAEVSRAGTMLAAIGMGMSTMRRRPTRTFLTAITVVALTFTILCFASFTREMGVRHTFLGAAAEDQVDGVLIRQLNLGELPTGMRQMLARLDDGDTVVTTRWWLNRANAGHPPMEIVNPATGDAVSLQAIVGLDPREVARWPALARLADDDIEARSFEESLRTNQLFLPAFAMNLLNVEPGDMVEVRGHRWVVGAPLDLDALQRLRGIDGESVVPVDTTIDEQAALAAERDEESLELEADMELELVRLSAGEVAVTSIEAVRRMGGDVRKITVYPAETLDARTLGRDIAHWVAMPVWSASEIGLERMILVPLTQVTGAMAVAVPLFLGGLIIFGTLLGSISDREKEIYTFSALGLGPSHVGMLFFAEAGVYAVVGGMGGQLLAQITALVASALANRGVIDPITINFSSTNSLFAIAVVMGVVLVSSLYPAFRASKSANPGLARSWQMPPPKGDQLEMTFPFTVSAYDITGVVSFLLEHFRSHDDAGLGAFATTDAGLRRNPDGNLELWAKMALAPFDLGVTESLVLSAQPSEIEGVDEVHLCIDRESGASGDWVRGTRVFLKQLRSQFLVWRTLNAERIESYRQRTFAELGEDNEHTGTNE